MKKFIAAFDGLRFSESTMEYAIFLAQQSNASLIGVFLAEHTQLGYALYETIIEQSHSGESIVKNISKNDISEVNKSIRIFRTACQRAGISHDVRNDKNDALKDLLHETIFADLLIIDADEPFSYIETNVPSEFVRNILHNSACPVIAVPGKFTPISELALLYDGSAASVNAIKMLEYALPGIKKFKPKLIYARDKSDSGSLPDNSLLKEWMGNHFPEIEYKTLKGGEQEIIATLASENPGMLIVTGAYNRSNMSMLFHGSLGNQIINRIKAPVFVAHI